MEMDVEFQSMIEKMMPAKRAAQMGETFVVRPQGGERLGKRALTLRVV